MVSWGLHLQLFIEGLRFLALSLVHLAGLDPETHKLFRRGSGDHLVNQLDPLGHGWPGPVVTRRVGSKRSPGFWALFEQRTET